MRRLIFAMILICAFPAYPDEALASDGDLKNIGKIHMTLILPDTKLEPQRIDLQNFIRRRLESADIPTDETSATQLLAKIEPGRQTHIVLSTTELTPLPNNLSVKKEVSIWTREANCSPKEIKDQLGILLDAFAIQYLKDNKNSTRTSSSSGNMNGATNPQNLDVSRSKDRVSEFRPGAMVDVTSNGNLPAILREFAPPPPGIARSEYSAEAIHLNNEGVRALQTNDFETAVIKLERALKMNPGYELSRQNLAIALNNFGLQRRNDYNSALRLFQWAVYLDPTNLVSHQNVDGIIRRMGKSDTSFEVRKLLAEDAEKSGDLPGALVEYQAACKIKPDADLRVRIGDIYTKRAEYANALVQYKLAQAISPSVDVHQKIENLEIKKK